jgi:hypothetical protein
VEDFMTTAPSDVTVTKTITTDIVWVRAHALIALLAVALIAGSIFGGVSLVESLTQKHDEHVAAAQQQSLGVSTAAQTALVAQLAQDREANTARDAVQTTLIQSLIAQMTQQRAATAKQVSLDATLDAKTAAAKLISQTKASPSDVTTSNDTVTMTLPVTRTVVADLDLLPQAQNDVTNLQGQLGAQKILTSDAKVELSTANQLIVADKLELISTIKADDAACTVRVDQQASKDRKRGFWVSLGSAIGGIIIGSRL